MSFHHRLFSYPPHLMVESADFDGTNDYMARGAALTGAADSKSGIFSAWFRIDGTDATKQLTLLAQLGSKLLVCRTIDLFSPVADSFLIQGVNSLGTVVVGFCSSTSYTQSATWRHLLASWDLSTLSTHLYVNDVDDKAAAGLVATNDTVVYTAADWFVGASSAGGQNKADGCIGELYFAPGQYLDFSVTNNRRKFITSSGKPVYLGADGAGPTGTAPLVYFHLDPSETVANFATNRGTGGDFTITGALTAGSTSPSDF